MATHTCLAFLRRLSPHVLPALLAIALASCDDDPTGPTTPTGAYEATSWTGTSGGTTTDVLAAGGSFAITLTPQGTTTGHLFIPDAVTGEGDFDSDLTGTWTQSGSIVEFNHTADTFVRDMPFTVQGTTLVGDRTFGDLRIRVTLTKTP
jgi:hypothetical protein